MVGDETRCVSRIITLLQDRRSCILANFRQAIPRRRLTLEPVALPVRSESGGAGASPELSGPYDGVRTSLDVPPQAGM